MNTIFTVTNQDLERFNPPQAVEIFRELIWAEARKAGLPLNRVHISDWINVPDGGVDAKIDGPEIQPPDGLIKVGKTAYQIKTGSFSPWQDAEIRNELFGRNQPADKEHLGSSIRDCLDNGGTYVLVCFGQDSVEPQRTQAITHCRSYFRLCGYDDSKVEVWGQNNLIGFISSFPSLALRVNGRQQAEFQTHQSWARQDTMLPSLVAGEEQQNMLGGIRDELRQDGEAVHIRIVGEAGMGKTKIVLEATRTDDLSPLVLYCNAERFVNSNLMNEILRDDNHYATILVLDECDEDNKTLIWNQLKNRGSRLKLISISNEFGRPSGDLRRFELEPLSSAQSSFIIQSYNIPKDRADVWSSLCSGYPRVAHVIGQNLITNPEDMLRSPDTVNVWRRFLVGTDNPDSEQVKQKERVLRHLALFRKFGYARSLEPEARAIAALIEEADPRITWARFQEIISELRGRKILQGAHTLYITPKLFHVKLWADWWDIHGTSFRLEEFSEKLPPSLIEWFYEMFEYARTSEAAASTVRRLLSADGPFQRADFLNSKAGGDFFFALSKAEPQAALNCLQRTVGTRSKEELLRFDKGRREVVWALEYIAVWKELFPQAARLLLRLGEAENERYSNNSSGIFVDLFSMAWGEVAPSEASPQEKITILREALDSDSPEKRSLALKASGKALEETDYFVRTINTNFIPLDRTPSRWTPKTYEEWFDGFRGVWKLVEEKIGSLTEEEKLQAAHLLLNSAYGLGQIPALSGMVIGTIRELLQKEYLDRLEVIEFLSQFLHKKSNKEMVDEVRQEWEKLRDDVSPRDFPSLMKRYVALDLLFDKFDDEEQYVDQAQPRIEELASQGAANPDLLKPELPWLTTVEAKRGFDFGYAIGTNDRAFRFSLLPILIQAQKEALNKETGSVFFLGGYFRALYQSDEGSYEKVLDILAQNDDLRVTVPELTFRGGITERGAERIVELAEAEKITFGHFRLFEYGLDTLKISQPTFHRWIEYLLSINDLYAVCVALNLMSLYYLHETKSKHEARPPLDKAVALRLLVHSSLFSQSEKRIFDQMCIWNWGRLAGRFVSLYPTESIELAKTILENFGEDAPVFGNLEKHPKEILHRVAAKYPFELWKIASQYLGPPIDVRAWRIKDWLHQSGIHFGTPPSDEVATIPLEKLWEWIDEDVEKRAWYVANFAPAILSRNENVTCLARELLIRYGEREDIRENLRANFGSGIWMGRASDHFKSKKQWLDDYKPKEDHPNVLRWIDEYIEQLDAQIEWETIREEREF